MVAVSDSMGWHISPRLPKATCERLRCITGALHLNLLGKYFEADGTRFDRLALNRGRVASWRSSGHRGFQLGLARS